MRKRRVCALLQSDFPPDVRFSREASALISAGYEIHLLCNNKSAHVQDQVHESIHIHRLKNITGKENGLSKAINTPLFFNPIWIVKLWQLYKKYHFDALHVVNLPLALLAIVFGRLLGISVVYDLYETYPEAIRSWKLKGFSRVVRNPRIADYLDRLCVKLANSLIVVTDEAKERLLKWSVPPDKVTVIENTVDLHNFFNFSIESAIVERYKKLYVITYVGQFSSERGLETAIEAMPRIIKEIPNARLLLVGGGPSYSDLVNYAKALGCEDIVEFTGWVDYKLFASYITASDVCIVPHPSNSFIDTTMPNKIFEYMALGKPVLVSDAKPLMRVVNECGCGDIFESLSSDSFAQGVIKIKNSMMNYSFNGKDAVNSKYNWQATSKELVKLYTQLVWKRKDEL